MGSNTAGRVTWRSGGDSEEEEIDNSVAFKKSPDGMDEDYDDDVGLFAPKKVKRGRKALTLDDLDEDYDYEGDVAEKKSTRGRKARRCNGPRLGDQGRKDNVFKKPDVKVYNKPERKVFKQEDMKVFKKPEPKVEEDRKPETKAGKWTGIPTPQECMIERRRLAEYHEILRGHGENAVRDFDFLEPTVKPVVLNVVASAGVGLTLDLKKIITNCKNVEYNPKRFAPCVMRIRKPRSTCLIFASGRMIVSGCKSEEESFIAVRRYVRILQKNAEPRITTIKSYEIQNMSASCTVPFGMLLRKIAETVKEYRQFVSYEPEIFPGLVWRLTCPKARIVLFCGGAILFTGLKSEEELQKAFKLLYPLCRFCRR